MTPLAVAAVTQAHHPIENSNPVIKLDLQEDNSQAFVQTPYEERTFSSLTAKSNEQMPNQPIFPKELAWPHLENVQPGQGQSQDQSGQSVPTT